MKKLIALTLVLVMAFAGAASAATFLSIATGGTSGTYYPIGGAIAAAVSKGAPDLQVTAETGNAAVANTNLVAAGDIEIAFVQADVMAWAYNGKMMFKSPLKNIRAIAALYPEHIQLVALKSAGVNKISDLKGKRVGVGAPGSGVEADVRALFMIEGLKYSDMKVDFLDFGATTSRLKDNQIDAGFTVAGIPTANIMDLATTKEITLINFDDAFMNKLIKEFPYFVKDKIPGKTYRGVDQDVTTPSVMAVLITHDKIADDVVYKFTKAMWENIADIQKSHAKAKEITLKSSQAGVSIPLHPGAAKYYKEKGIVK